MMSEISVDKYSLKDIKSKFENREFAIPEIQRQYVWNKSRVCNLMDSIYKNYPVGIFLVWNAKYSKAIQIRPNNKTIIPPFNRKNKTADLIIDGQQRLSTLFGVLNNITPKPEANSIINFKELFFNYNKNPKKIFVFSYRLNEDSEGYIRLHELLITLPSVLKKRLKLTKLAAKECEKCYERFHKYKYYVLTFNQLEINDVQEIFIRINSSGMTVSRADAVFSRATKVGLRDHMLDAKRGLKHNYDNISIDALQSTLALSYDANKIGGRAFEIFLNKIEKNKNDNSEFLKKWKKLQYGYEMAVDFLVNEFKIISPALLPYQNIYTMLAFFFYLSHSRIKPYQMREIKKWFWHTACGERYTGADFNRSIPEDIKFFKKLVKNPNTKYTISEKINPSLFLRSDYRKASSSSHAYFILLRNKKPLYLLNGHEMMLDNASAISNRKDRHHIYPKNLLDRHHINPKWTNSITNICYVESNENQSINNSHPKNYLKEFKHKQHFGKVMTSHIIPYRSLSPVWSANVKKGFRSFIYIRGKMILDEIEKLAGVKIFEILTTVSRI